MAFCLLTELEASPLTSESLHGLTCKSEVRVPDSSQEQSRDGGSRCDNSLQSTVDKAVASDKLLPLSLCLLLLVNISTALVTSQMIEP